MSDAVCRLMETRLCPPSWYCKTLCARFESDDPTPWMERNQSLMTSRNAFENNDPIPDQEDVADNLEFDRSFLETDQFGRHKL